MKRIARNVSPRPVHVRGHGVLRPDEVTGRRADSKAVAELVSRRVLAYEPGHEPKPRKPQVTKRPAKPKPTAAKED